ncbi:MAG: hypothetical protein QM532_01180 [Cyanobium sp. MAG06]|nr:hypothetical protein [Cyanobium sp. MAG06]
MNIIYKKDITSKELSNNKYTILNIYKNDEDKVIKKNYINLKIDEENYNNRRFIKLIRQLTIFANKEKVKNLIIYIKDINNIFVDNIIDNNNNETLCDNI